MKDVFLIGDSITMAYADKVGELLGDDVKIWRTASDMSNYEVENARWTGYTLNNLARHMWLQKLPKKFDAIHWNNGIWDTVIRYPEDG
ncbi:MAG: SGNH/GDSL hydrolase family protein, partial [Clostridia bacterium]|nr:SGNH/GDSL hydrolase family protein [Clostridia bacterium]